jgi:integrase
MPSDSVAVMDILSGGEQLRTDRYIPLHPQLKDLLDAWLAGRPASLRTPWLFTEHGQRIGAGRVDRAVAKAASAAGIGHVSPHRLRHTLATQAINRGMSLEAIAALLGHRSMRMTMVYAKAQVLRRVGEVCVVCLARRGRKCCLPGMWRGALTRNDAASRPSDAGAAHQSLALSDGRTA